MKRLLMATTLLALAVTAAWWLLLPGLLERILEREGSAALLAPVTIDSAQPRLLPPGLDLYGVRLGEPHRSLQAVQVHAAIDIDALTAGQLVAEQVQLRGLQLHHGAGHTPPDTSNLPAPAATAAGIALRIRGELNEIATALTAIDTRWQERMGDIPHADRTALRQLEQALRVDLAQVRPLLARAQALPEEELARQLTTQPLAGASARPTQALLGQRFAPLIRELAALAQPPTYAAGWPLLARRVILSGELKLGSTPLPLQGELRNVTPQPAQWRLPLSFDLSAGGDQLRVSGNIDQPEGSGALQLHASHLPLAGVTLSAQSPLEAAMSRATVDATGVLTLAGGRIDGAVDATFSNVAWQLDAATESPVAQRAAQVLSAVDTFDLQLQLDGSATAPELTLQSSLDALLQPALAQALPQESLQRSERLRDELAQHLAPEQRRIEAITSRFNALQQQLAERRAALGG